MKTDVPIAIAGLGYVGLPLALHFAHAGVPVIGLDVDAAKIARLVRGESYILHIPSARVAAAVDAGRFTATTDLSRVRDCQAVIICVPTPLKGENEPDLSYVLDTGRALAPHLAPGTLVVLESTTYPGTTDGELRAVLEAGSGRVAGTGFHLAYSPEREDPGNPESDVSAIPKVVGGLTPACRDRALALYGRVVRSLVPVADCRVAEAVKLTENIFRAVNIAMVNELKVVYAAMGIDIWDVLAAAPGTTAVLNAANEVAVAAFLDRKIQFDHIHAVNTACLADFLPSPPASLEDLLAIDLEARQRAQSWVNRLSKATGRASL